ncbi:MAG: hypoxanthine phosphoribosyltransferase [bacterium]
MIEKIKRCVADPKNILLHRDDIAKKVTELASQINQDYTGGVPVFICVLNGGFLFYADLIREITIDCEVDFLKASSYGNALKSSGEVKILKPPDCPLENRDVVVVEDIIDTGLSVYFLRNWLRKQKPKSIKFVSLLVKEGAAQVEYECEYPGFRIPNQFVVGYGLDFAQRFRNLQDIYVVPT